MSPEYGKSPIVTIPVNSLFLREFLHGAVNGKFWGQIWLLKSPVLGLIHYGPPHLSYTGLYEWTATKS